MMEEICQVLDWDSHFFGFPIARVRHGRLTQRLLDPVNRWCCSQGIRCLYFMADPNDAESVESAELGGFHLADVRLTFARKIESGSVMPPRIRSWCQSDLPALAALARVSHRDTRFYFDDGFANSRCDDLYETWIRNSCAGYADAVLLAQVDDQTAGYVTCHLEPNSEGRIGLLAVSRDFHRQGIGSNLIRGALNWFAGLGVTRASVTTQLRHVAGQRLYQRCGFRTASAHLLYHRWFPPAG